MQPDNLISLKDDMVAFIAGHGMRRLSAFITEDVPTVIFEEENADGWKDFVEHAKAAVLNSLTSLDAQRGYRHAIDEFVDWYCSEPRLALNRIVVLRYRSHLESRQLAPGTVNLRLGAVRRLACEAAACCLLSADLAAVFAALKA